MIPGYGSFRKDLESLINRYSRENGSNTPDFILAEYLENCLDNFDKIVNAREIWYGRGEENVTTPSEDEQVSKVQ